MNWPNANSAPMQSNETPWRLSRETALHDYKLAFRSRQASIVAHKEVPSGKAKFGIFGAGKEVPQVAMAHAFRKGDFRAGYYRDQTMMFALGMLTVEEYFAQLYANAELTAEPAFGGRHMTGHFATRLLHPDGSWKDLRTTCNSSADVSPTGAQMPRLLGLAYASVLYRRLEELRDLAATGFSDGGNEVAFGTIGNASCAEGIFWEAVNAAGVLQIPMLLSIWDDGYGISVPNQFQMTLGDIYRVLEGFQRRPGEKSGLDVYSVEGWNYPQLCETYIAAAESVRRNHMPVVIHVTELTQPLGHSTSGSQQRYKSPERLEWEKGFDCIPRMRGWVVSEGHASEREVEELEEEEKEQVLAARDRAWAAYRRPIDAERDQLLAITRELGAGSGRAPELTRISDGLAGKQFALRRDLMAAAEEALIAVRLEDIPARQELSQWKRKREQENWKRYSSDLYSETAASALKVPEVRAIYSERSPLLQGFEILNACFDAAFTRYPQLIAMGEDVGQLGDVNQAFAQLQKKYGALRITDTGIREATILGQAIGMALRGLRPIAEIQYLDYVLYALQIMSDDLATLRWRTRGGQKAPVIIRTRGHRLEGIWHSGSPMSGLLGLLRGIYICVPRDSTQAAGFYNTILRSDDPALIVEVLNAYRRKAPLPDNIGEFTIPLGVPEVIRAGKDVTVVTYGACCTIAEEAAEMLRGVGIEAEIIDVRTLLPFDIHGAIVASLRKTNRVLFVDEDVPGGATAYMMQQTIERNGYEWLDAAPRALPAREHRPPYGSDGDYFSKPNREQIFEAVYGLMHEANPRRFPLLHPNG
jgi:pyruvate/2-oxoglutarate/acetoin dehydrogenase E1 component/TPP-dependent pyruvate/acetoin dehydrogenase alpha subunit